MLLNYFFIYDSAQQAATARLMYLARRNRYPRYR